MYLLNEALAREHSRELDRRAGDSRLRREAARRPRHRDLHAAGLLRHRRQPALAAAVVK
jgi:hypothetical protein